MTDHRHLQSGGWERIFRSERVPSERGTKNACSRVPIWASESNVSSSS